MSKKHKRKVFHCEVTINCKPMENRFDNVKYDNKVQELITMATLKVVKEFKFKSYRKYE